VLPANAIEGVTVDERGTIYLVAEQAGVLGGKSQLIVLTPVPEPSTYAMMIAGIGLLGFMARRRQRQARTASH